MFSCMVFFCIFFSLHLFIYLFFEAQSAVRSPQSAIGPLLWPVTAPQTREKKSDPIFCLQLIFHLYPTIHLCLSGPVLLTVTSFLFFFVSPFGFSSSATQAIISNLKHHPQPGKHSRHRLFTSTVLLVPRFIFPHTLKLILLSRYWLVCHSKSTHSPTRPILFLYPSLVYIRRLILLFPPPHLLQALPSYSPMIFFLFSFVCCILPDSSPVAGTALLLSHKWSPIWVPTELPTLKLVTQANNSIQPIANVPSPNPTINNIWVPSFAEFERRETPSAYSASASSTRISPPPNPNPNPTSYQRCLSCPYRRQPDSSSFTILLRGRPLFCLQLHCQQIYLLYLPSPCFHSSKLGAQVTFVMNL
ncbi:putative signal peptide protein [Puccinia sorghi]|uniref:Putative signal peptide protein n=1 Tax=Puccinia sorghi TaxID=27349 RepID=A0A0L6V8Q5_9BASI|nr:putative signal peptide protein [Puccinia sorghi]